MLYFSVGITFELLAYSFCERTLFSCEMLELTRDKRKAEANVYRLLTITSLRLFEGILFLPDSGMNTNYTGKKLRAAVLSKKAQHNCPALIKMEALHIFKWARIWNVSCCPVKLPKCCQPTNHCVCVCVCETPGGSSCHAVKTCHRVKWPTALILHIKLSIKKRVAKGEGEGEDIALTSWISLWLNTKVVRKNQKERSEGWGKEGREGGWTEGGRGSRMMMTCLLFPINKKKVGW